MIEMDFTASLVATAGGGILTEDETLLKCSTVAFEMLSCRGYTTINPPPYHVSIIKSKMSSLTPLFTGTSSSRQRPDTHVYFTSELKIGVKLVREIMECHENDNHRIVLVSTQGCTSSKPMNQMTNVEFVTYKQISNNIMKHVLVPEHIYIDSDSATTIFKSYTSTKEKFPVLLSTDPVALFCDFRIGDLIQIKKNSMGGNVTAGISYRVVTPSNV